MYDPPIHTHTQWNLIHPRSHQGLAMLMQGDSLPFSFHHFSICYRAAGVDAAPRVMLV